MYLKNGNQFILEYHGSGNGTQKLIGGQCR